MMMARHLSKKDFPFAGRIDWLVTHPKYRRKGFALICASASTKRLLDAGYKYIWVTTQDHRLGAIKTFLKIGYKPKETQETKLRWKNIYDKLDI